MTKNWKRLGLRYLWSDYPLWKWRKIDTLCVISWNFQTFLAADKEAAIVFLTGDCPSILPSSLTVNSNSRLTELALKREPASQA